MFHSSMPGHGASTQSSSSLSLSPYGAQSDLHSTVIPNSAARHAAVRTWTALLTVLELRGGSAGVYPAWTSWTAQSMLRARCPLWG